MVGEQGGRQGVSRCTATVESRCRTLPSIGMHTTHAETAPGSSKRVDFHTLKRSELHTCKCYRVGNRVFTAARQSFVRAKNCTRTDATNRRRTERYERLIGFVLQPKEGFTRASISKAVSRAHLYSRFLARPILFRPPRALAHPPKGKARKNQTTS